MKTQKLSVSMLVKKISLGIVIFSSIIGSYSISAGDDISIIINGKTYSCGDNEAEQYRFYCECDHRSSGWYWPAYMKVNIQTGYSQKVRNLADYTGLASCKKNLENFGVCRGL